MCLILSIFLSFSGKQLYTNTIVRRELTVVAEWNGVRFVDNAITSNWYNGNYALYWLKMRLDYLHTIHADAFSDWAMHRLIVLELNVTYGTVIIDANAFSGFEMLRSIVFSSKTFKIFPVGTLDPLADSLWFIQFNGWPNFVSLGEMFANKKYGMLKVLRISDVKLPQIKFRVLAAGNFSTFRRIEVLVLNNCGIEVIEEHTFDAIAKTLHHLDLQNNWIKLISVELFRNMFETKPAAQLLLHSNHELPLCTCQLMMMDIMQCPFRTNAYSVCFRCELIDGYDDTKCGNFRDVYLPDICYHSTVLYILRIVDIRLAYEDDTIAIETYFAGKFRMLVVNFDAMQRGQTCAERANRTNFRCLNVNRSVYYLDMMEWDEVRNAEFISITAIPILYRFGARPMHSITVRNDPKLNEPAATIDVLELIGMAILSCALSSIVGFIVVLGTARFAAFSISNPNAQPDICEF